VSGCEREEAFIRSLVRESRERGAGTGRADCGAETKRMFCAVRDVPRHFGGRGANLEQFFVFAVLELLRLLPDSSLKGERKSFCRLKRASVA